MKNKMIFINTCISAVWSRRTLILISIYISFFLLFLFNEYRQSDDLEFGICFTERCLDALVSRYPNFIELNKWMVTTAAIIIAARSLILSQKGLEQSRKNNIFNNHISNKRFFTEHLNMEIDRKEFVDKRSVNANKFYSLVFPNSSLGEHSISNEYKSAIKKIRGYLIRTSNSSKKGAQKKEAFDYKAHQKTLSNHLNKLGFDIVSLPKKDFYLVEEEIFQIIDSVTELLTDWDISYYLTTVDIHYR